MLVCELTVDWLGRRRGGKAELQKLLRTHVVKDQKDFSVEDESVHFVFMMCLTLCRTAAVILSTNESRVRFRGREEFHGKITCP